MKKIIITTIFILLAVSLLGKKVNAGVHDLSTNPNYYSASISGDVVTIRSNNVYTRKLTWGWAHDYPFDNSHFDAFLQNHPSNIYHVTTTTDVRRDDYLCDVVFHCFKQWVEAYIPISSIYSTSRINFVKSSAQQSGWMNICQILAANEYNNITECSPSNVPYCPGDCDPVTQDVSGCGAPPPSGYWRCDNQCQCVEGTCGDGVFSEPAEECSYINKTQDPTPVDKKIDPLDPDQRRIAVECQNPLANCIDCKCVSPQVQMIPYLKCGNKLLDEGEECDIAAEEGEEAHYLSSCTEQPLKILKGCSNCKCAYEYIGQTAPGQLQHQYAPKKIDPRVLKKSFGD